VNAVRRSASFRRRTVRWLLAAAEQGLPHAQAKLAEAYAEGPDVSGRDATACGWFLLAAMSLRGIHRHRAQTEYERIASHLTPAQIATARVLCARLDTKADETSR
jgi:TPR repeat protein